MEPTWWDLTIPDGQYDPRISPQRGLAHVWVGHTHFPKYRGRRHPQAIPVGFKGKATVWLDLPSGFTPRNGWGTGPLNFHDSPIPHGWRGVSPLRIMMEPSGLGVFSEYPRVRRKVPIEPYIGTGPHKLELYFHLSRGSDGYYQLDIDGETVIERVHTPIMRSTDEEVLLWAGYYYPATGEAGHTNPGTTRLRISTPVLEGTSPIGPPILPEFTGWWGSYGRGSNANATAVRGETVGEDPTDPPVPPDPPEEPVPVNIVWEYGTEHRNPTALLHGATVSGPIYLAATPDGPVSYIEVSINDATVGDHSGRESYPPYDFGTGVIPDTTQPPFVEGTNTAYATAYSAQGSELGYAEATFMVDNVADPEPPPETDPRDERIAELEGLLANAQALLQGELERRQRIATHAGAAAAEIQKIVAELGE